MVRPVAALLLLLTAGCATATSGGAGAGAAPPAAAPTSAAPGPAPGSDPRDVLLRFAQAARGGRWGEAWPLLSERWRATTSPGRLAADWRGAGPVAREAADRVVALLEGDGRLAGDGDVLRLPVGPGRAARLVREPAGWRVDALE